MLDFNNSKRRIVIVGQEDRALQRCNPSAWSMPEDGQEHVFAHMLLPSRSSFGYKAKNLLCWCEAPIRVKQVKHISPVRHMRLCRNYNSKMIPFLWRYVIMCMS